MKIEKLYYLFLPLLAYLLFSCSEDQGEIPLPEPEEYIYLISATSERDSWTTSELGDKIAVLDVDPMYLALMPNTEICISEIHYRTTDPAGSPVVASGLLAYPASGHFKGVIVAEHFTTSADREVPTSSGLAIESLYSLFGYVVISPDYLGFGTTVDLPHPYLHVESVGRVSVDMVLAVREYMQSVEMPLPDGVLVVGYSQGGACALAFQKMAEEEYAEEIPIIATMAGGGPYDPVALFEEMQQSDEAAFPCSLPLTAVGLDYGDDLRLDFSKIFRGALLENYADWIGSKHYTTGEINRLIASHRVSDFMHPDLFLKDMNSELQKFYASLQKNRLTDWTPKAPIWLLHADNDTYVSFTCARNAYNAFKAKGCPVELEVTYSGHKETGLLFYMKVLSKLKEYED